MATARQMKVVVELGRFLSPAFFPGDDTPYLVVGVTETGEPVVRLPDGSIEDVTGGTLIVAGWTEGMGRIVHPDLPAL